MAKCMWCYKRRKEIQLTQRTSPFYSGIFVNESDIEENGMEVMGEEDMMFETYYLSSRTIITNSILLFSNILCLWYFHFIGYVGMFKGYCGYQIRGP